MPAQVIKISGARQHNLKNLHAELPREKLVVITGLSGSGKSSLAFDTLYAEEQHCHVETLFTYAEHFSVKAYAISFAIIPLGECRNHQ